MTVNNGWDMWRRVRVKGQTWHLPTAVAGDTGGVQTGIDSGAVLVAVYSTEDTGVVQTGITRGVVDWHH